MPEIYKDQQAILEKLGIENLNPMQLAAQQAITSHDEIVLLSPTGTGKTLAFLLPLIAGLDPDERGVQALILTPSRELAIQIETVIREMGSGYKANAVYGGRSGYKDRMEITHAPAILVGTPGRVADHMRRENVDMDRVRTLVLDEFDKSLEVGFSEEMSEIISSLPGVNKKILTSATERIEVPAFVGIRDAVRLEFLQDDKPRIKLYEVVSSDEDTLFSLIDLLRHIGPANGIIFCNFKDSIRYVSEALDDEAIDHGCFYGGLEQHERERALIKFRNGTHRILVATDLAARGIDVPDMDFIIHLEMPHSKEEFIHRNGRTARMKSEGSAYIIRWKKHALRDYVQGAIELRPEPKHDDLSSSWATLFIGGGRKDKISKGDIAGLFFKQGGLEKHELGLIELKQDAAYVSVPLSKSGRLVQDLNNSRLKKKKVRIRILD